ncbi:MAG: DUF4012 domain-containing protein, partial [Caldilineaceae bacterium]|nr:DUF4012 domain-containing protein [Caldilineaceae bacterium]
YLLFRDANWSPDFPTTAMLLRTLYHEETGVMVDGIVTVDLHALRYIVGALAPLRLPNAPEPLTEANVLEQVKALWGQPEAGETITDVGLNQWWGQRKNFIPALAASVLAKVQSGDIDYVALAMAVERSLNERAIQIWLAEEHAATQLATLGWDGRLRVDATRDYLSLIDTNMGYNKANAVIERSLHYTVTWPTNGAPAEATVTIDYRHPITLPNHTCDITPRYGSDYQDLVERCFFNYVRLYVPQGSTLVEATGFLENDSVRTARGERRTQVFAGYFVLPPGEQARIQFRYQLPPLLTQENYQLIVQRQAGSGPLSLVVTIAGERQEMVVREGITTVPSPSWGGLGRG